MSRFDSLVISRWEMLAASFLRLSLLLLLLLWPPFRPSPPVSRPSRSLLLSPIYSMIRAIGLGKRSARSKDAEEGRSATCCYSQLLFLVLKNLFADRMDWKRKNKVIRRKESKLILLKRWKKLFYTIQFVSQLLQQFSTNISKSDIDSSIAN